MKLPCVRHTARPLPRFPRAAETKGHKRGSLWHRNFPAFPRPRPRWWWGWGGRRLLLEDVRAVLSLLPLSPPPRVAGSPWLPVVTAPRSLLSPGVLHDSLCLHTAVFLDNRSHWVRGPPHQCDPLFANHIGNDPPPHKVTSRGTGTRTAPRPLWGHLHPGQPSSNAFPKDTSTVTRLVLI